MVVAAEVKSSKKIWKKAEGKAAWCSSAHFPPVFVWWLHGYSYCSHGGWKEKISSDIPGKHQGKVLKSKAFIHHFHFQYILVSVPVLTSETLDSLLYNSENIYLKMKWYFWKMKNSFPFGKAKVIQNVGFSFLSLKKRWIIAMQCGSDYVGPVFSKLRTR